MSIAGIGIDLVNCARIENSIERFGDRFLHRVFTAGEIAYSQSMKFPSRHFAARFAAKEALSKAFGTGIGKSMGWRDLDVQRKESGEPYVVLSGGAEKMAKERGINRVWISLSHTEETAAATIVLEAHLDSNR
jgi:holo-[acyl-carrier protein] synthase